MAYFEFSEATYGQFRVARGELSVVIAEKLLGLQQESTQVPDRGLAAKLQALDHACILQLSPSTQELRRPTYFPDESPIISLPNPNQKECPICLGNLRLPNIDARRGLDNRIRTHFSRKEEGTRV